MKLIGYGVTRNEKPTGIWPLPERQALATRDRLRSNNPRTVRFEVVPVYIGSPITAAPLPVMIEPTPGTDQLA